MTATTTTTRKTIRELLAEQAGNLVPTDGDRAFTLYHGLIWEGILRKTEWNGQEGWGGGWVIIPADSKTCFDNREGDIHYGYHKYPVANVSVYAPDEWHLEQDEGDNYNPEKFGMSSDSKKRVRFDTVRGMFYLRAYED